MGASFKKGAQIYDNVDINDEVRSESSGHSGKTGLSGLSGVTGKTAHSHGSKASSFSRKKENTDEFVSSLHDVLQFDELRNSYHNV